MSPVCRRKRSSKKEKSSKGNEAETFRGHLQVQTKNVSSGEGPTEFQMWQIQTFGELHLLQEHIRGHLQV